MSLKSFVMEMEKLSLAYNLLEKIFNEIGPYRTNEKISNETWFEVCRFFNFDDSE